MSKDFLQWVEDELRRRAWHNAELAREGGLSESTVSRTLNGQTAVTFGFCNGVALAFKIRPEPLYRQAGLAPPLPPAIAEEQEIIHHIRSLNEHDRDTILRALRGLSEETTPAPSPQTAQERSPRRTEEGMETPLIGKAILDLDNPYRIMYDALADILTVEQWAHLFTRLAEMAAENNALGNSNDQRGEVRRGVLGIPGGIVTATEGHARTGS